MLSNASDVNGAWMPPAVQVPRRRDGVAYQERARVLARRPRSNQPGSSIRHGASARCDRGSRMDAHDPFDGYPYLVTSIGRCALRHMAILPADWAYRRLLDLA